MRAPDDPSSGRSSRERYVLGEPIDIGREVGLLIDDTLVEDRWNVERRLNLPLKHPRNPLLVADLAWEEGCVYHPSVLYDPDARLFRMWYQIYSDTAYNHLADLNDWDPRAHGYPYAIAYAESDDGIAWRKPLVGVAHRGHDRSNVVFNPSLWAHGHRVIWNHPSSGRPGRFLMSYADRDANDVDALFLAYSDDGITWWPDPANPVVVPIMDTVHNVLYDAASGRWLFYTRPATTAGRRDGPVRGYHFKRRAAVAIGDTPQRFGPLREIRWPDEHEAPDYDDFVVSKVGTHFLAFASYMDNFPDLNVRTHLLFSGDGLHWQRLPDVTPLIALGRPGDFDAGQASTVKNVVEVGDFDYLYYYGSPVGQGIHENRNAIGLAQLRRDRFIAQVGGALGGYLLTRELKVTGPRLHLNVTLAHPGEHRSLDRSWERGFAVELVSAPRGGVPCPIPGYTFDECITPAGDLLDVVARWREHADLTRLMGQSVYVRFYLKNVGLYSVRFGD